MRYPSCSPIVPALFVALVAPGCQRDREAAAILEEHAAEAAEETAIRPAPAARMPQVEAVLTEWEVGLSPDTVEAGRVTFNVVNRGTTVHAFEVEDEDREWQTQRLQPGESTTLVADLTPGVYEVYCPVEDEHGEHDDLGMRTTLVVR